MDETGGGDALGLYDIFHAKTELRVRKTIYSLSKLCMSAVMSGGDTHLLI